jgi:hypothetical protein
MGRILVAFKILDQAQIDRLQPLLVPKILNRAGAAVGEIMPAGSAAY